MYVNTESNPTILFFVMVSDPLNLLIVKSVKTPEKIFASLESTPGVGVLE